MTPKAFSSPESVFSAEALFNKVVFYAMQKAIPGAKSPSICLPITNFDIVCAVDIL
jgi:hypothetical protein